MEKIRLKLLGLARNISQNNAYTLVLADAQEQMQIPLTVGLAEAQAVAMLMESIFWERPVMFQLLNNFAHELGAKLEEVFLHKVENQQFFTRLLFRTPNVKSPSTPAFPTPSCWLFPTAARFTPRLPSSSR